MQENQPWGYDLLVEVFHRSRTEDDQKTDPESGSLKGNCFIGLFFACFYVIGLEEHGIKEECEKTENEKQLDKEDDQVCRMVLDPASGLRGDKLIDIVKINATGKQQNHEQNARNLLVMLIERVGDRLDLFLRDCQLQPGCHGNDEECESADPDDRRQQVKPMIDDRDQRVRIGNEAAKRVHVYNS